MILICGNWLISFCKWVFYIFVNFFEFNNEVCVKGRNVDVDNSFVIVFKFISNRCLYIFEKMVRGLINLYFIVYIFYLD